MPPPLHIPPACLEAMLAHCRRELPNEACGFLAGRDGVVMDVLPLVNERASPTAFRTEARSVFAAFRAMRAGGTELLALYHSHPTGEPVPSRRDLAENTYGELPWVIVGADETVQAWRLHADRADELPFNR